MDRLFPKIREQVMRGRYMIGQHAVERLDERGILEWQVVDGIEQGRFLRERPDGYPHPVVEVEQTLADTTLASSLFGPTWNLWITRSWLRYTFCKVKL